MKRSKAARNRKAIEDDSLGDGELDDADAEDSVGSGWEDAALDEREDSAELDDQDLEIARLLGQDV